VTLAADDPRHGTENGYRNLGCRCRPCKDAHAAYYREGPGYEAMQRYLRRTGHVSMAEWRELSAAKHGGTTSYKNGCRCFLCCEAARIARALHRSEVLRGYRHTTKHGTHGTYGSGCRCDECRAANTAYHRAYRARQRGHDEAA
jgi:hypothetical protein